MGNLKATKFNMLLDLKQELLQGYTETYTSKWEGAVVNYNFVSNGKDSLKDAAFFVDENIGISKVYFTDFQAFIQNP